MRNRFVSVPSLSLLLLATTSLSSHAAEITISEALTDPQETATIDGGAPGDIMIDASGSIIVTSGTALSLNSDNLITNDGNLQVEDSNGSVTVLISGGFTGNFQNNNDIFGNATDESTWGSNKTGLLLAGPGAFTGNIGNGPSATIAVAGDNSYGAHLTTSLVGNFDNEGTVAARGNNSYGLVIGDTVTGFVRNAGVIASNIVVLDTDNNPETFEFFSTYAAVGIGASISGGFLNDGLTIDEANDEIDDDGTLVGTITSSGSEFTILISPILNASGPTDIVLGPVADVTTSEGFVNLGEIISVGQSTADLTAIRIEGLDDAGTLYTTTLSGGFRNDGTIEVTAVDANATGLSIGALTSVPTITNNGVINVKMSSEDGPFEAVAIDLNGPAGSTTLVNNGTINAQAVSTDGRAVSILDDSGAITSIVNNGIIAATQSTLVGGVTDPLSRGIAIDLTANGSGVLLTNQITASATENTTGLIGGDILFGSGNDEFIVNSGEISGEIDFGGGNDTLSFNGGTMAGDIFFGTGVNTFNLGPDAILNGDLLTGSGNVDAFINGELNSFTKTQVSLNSLTIGSSARILIPIGVDSATNFGFVVSGNATIDSSATFVPVFDSILTSTLSLDIITAGSLTLTGGLPAMDLASVPVLYDFSFTSAGNLEMNIRPKTVSELNLTSNQAIVFDPLIELATTDEELTTVLHSLRTEQELFSTINQVTPNFTNATYQLGMSGFEGLAVSALNTRHRDSTTNRHNTRFWAQQAGLYRDQQAFDDVAGYVGQEFKMSGGLDVATNSLDRLGIAASVSYFGFEPEGAPTNPYNTTATWFAVYAAKQMGNFEVNMIGGYSFTKNTSERVVSIKSAYLRADGDWSGSQWAGRIEAKARLGGAKYYMQPKATLTYFSLSEDNYTETGDAGISVIAPDFSMDGARVQVGSVFGLRTGKLTTTYTTELELGWRQDFGTSSITREYQFVGGATPFELTTTGSEEGAVIVGLSFFGGTDFTTFGFAYTGAFEADASDHYIRAVLRSRF